MISFTLSAHERMLLNEIEEVAYGELFDIHYKDEEIDTSLEVSLKCKSFIQTLRKRKRITRIIIHDCEPVIAEIECNTTSGLKCLQKIKF